MNEIVPNEGMLDRINNLLEAQSYAVDYFIALPDEQKAAATAPTATLELTLEWHLAFYLLVFNPDSPFVEPDEVPEGQQRALAACLQNASNEAQHAFAPMVLAIRHFDVARLAGWEWWSETMGARERHLQRRHQNPVFAPERRVVTASDVYSARLLDAKDYDEALETLKSIGKALVDFQPVNNWEATLNGMKAQLETLQLRILGMDRRGADLRPKTELLRSHAIGYMTDLLKQVDPGQLPAIEELEARRVQFLARYPCDWSWQVYRGDVIPDDEAALALLCESVESIAQIVKGAEELGQHPIDASHATCLSHAKAEFADIARTLHATGHEIPRFEEKLRILGQRVTC
jgi:hypothetical protein